MCGQPPPPPAARLWAGARAPDRIPPPHSRLFNPRAARSPLPRHAAPQPNKLEEDDVRQVLDSLQFEGKIDVVRCLG